MIKERQCFVIQRKTGDNDFLGMGRQVDIEGAEKFNTPEAANKFLQMYSWAKGEYEVVCLYLRHETFKFNSELDDID